MKTFRQQIAEVDRKIDAVRDEMLKLEEVEPMDASSWQAAWDRHPDMHKAELDLFHHRGKLQLLRDESEAQELARLSASSKRFESKAAIKHNHVFTYLYDCKQSAKLLGFKDLASHYERGLNEFRLATA